METTLSRNKFIIAAIIIATLTITFLIQSGKPLKALISSVELETETMGTFDEKCKFTRRMVYNYLSLYDDKLYILRGVSEKHDGYENAVKFKYAAPHGGRASWREHDAGILESDWVSHTIDLEIAFYYATNGYATKGVICFKRITHLDLQGEVGYGGEHNESQIGFKGITVYDGFVHVSPDMSLEEVRAVLSAKGCKTYF